MKSVSDVATTALKKLFDSLRHGIYQIVAVLDDLGVPVP